jgi:uncharacterized RDD family membrane protein YckC
MENSFFVTTKVLANKGARFFNFIIDQIIIIFIAICISILLDVIFYIQTVMEITKPLFISENPKLTEYLFISLITFIYYFLSEAYTGKTIGKWITGTLMVDSRGEKPPYSRILKRSFLRLIPFENISFLGHRARGWHDQYSYTYVVNKKKFEADKSVFENLLSLGKTD